jgi:hypothetical protein
LKSESDEPLSPWAERAVAAGRLNEAEHRERLHRNQERRRADLACRVPPVVIAEGPEAVAAWLESMLDRDPRLALVEDSRHADADPRAPLPPLPL